MPITTYTLAGNFSALVGEISRLRATIHANSDDGSWVNELDDEIKLGGALLITATDGTFTVTLPTSSGTGLQYEVRAEYVDPSTQQRKTWSSGWFDLTANANLADKANDSSLRINPSQAAQLAARIDGYVDHGSVSGAQSINPLIGTHVIDASGATTLTLADAANGTVVTLLVTSGAENVTVAGIADLELADGAFATFVRIRDVWVLAAAGGSGGEAPVTDTTPPTGVTGLTATGGEGQVTFNWTASTDAESPVKYGYRVWLTSGGATGAYVTRTSVGPVTVSGLTAGNYTVQVYSFSNGGNTTPVTATANVTVDPYPGTNAYDTFTGSSNGNIGGRSTEKGALTWSSGGNTPGMILGGQNSGAGVLSSQKLSGGSSRVDTAHVGVTVEADYVLATAPSRCTLMLTGNSDGTQSIIARIIAGEGLKVYYNGETQLGTDVSGIATSGRLSLAYNAGTGAVTVKVDGVTKLTGTIAGQTGTYSGIEANNATIDNVTWAWS